MLTQLRAAQPLGGSSCSWRIHLLIIFVVPLSIEPELHLIGWHGFLHSDLKRQLVLYPSVESAWTKEMFLELVSAVSTDVLASKGIGVPSVAGAVLTKVLERRTANAREVLLDEIHAAERVNDFAPLVVTSLLSRSVSVGS